MKVSAAFRRLILVVIVLFLLSSCVGGVKRQQSDSASASDANLDATAGTLQDAGSASYGADTSAMSDVKSSRILSAQGDAIGLELVDGGQGDQLVISTDVGTPEYTVTRLNDPDRLVLDIKGEYPSSVTRTFDTSDTEYLNRVRIGAHPGKSRIVLDLPEGLGVQHQVDARDGALIVTLASAQQSLDVVAASMQQPQGSAIGDEAVQPLLIAENAPDAVLVKDEGIDDSAKAAPNLDSTGEYAATGTAALQSIALEQVGASSNMLVASISNPGAYSFERTAPSEYVLTLKNARREGDIAPTVSLPNSGLIRSARAIEQGSDVLIRVFAQPGAELEARAGTDKIVVVVSKDSPDVMAADMRAQAAPEKAGAEEAASPEAKPVAEVKETQGSDDEMEDFSSLVSMQKYKGRKISLDLQDTDIDNALRIIAEVSNLNIIASDDVTGKVTLRLIDVPWDQALDVILKTNGLDSVQEGNVVRIAPIDKLNQERQALRQLQLSQAELEPLQVRYIRVSYAKASDLKPLVETVISERGVVTYDERTNQIIVKDINSGIENVSQLIGKIDLRTPQVLLETQIVEANRSILRSLGSELGFEFVASPETGNATGYNFPNTINVAGSAVDPSSKTGSSFPAAVDDAGGSAITMLLGSADGSKSLGLRISALETEGRARIISRPAVATTNNKPATIKSVEKVRVKTPDGGLSVATGQGASAAGSSTVATESIEAGITLDVTPQASPDYYVLLDIKAKSSTFGSRLVEGIPNEFERSANSTVLVSSGQTFALGGIYKLIDQDTVAGVPFFKDIPVLGTLFRSTKIDNSDEELLFFITPRIIEGSFDDATMKVSS